MKAEDFDKKAEEFTKAAKELNDTPDRTADFDPQDVAANKVYAVLAYFGILVLVPMLAAKDSKYAQFHANQGLILFLLEVIVSVFLGIISGIKVLAIIFTIVLNLGILAFLVIGIINAVDGRAKELPLIGKFRILTSAKEM